MGFPVKVHLWILSMEITPEIQSVNFFYVLGVGLSMQNAWMRSVPSLKDRIF